jgi:predicted glutamine amidotransferase
MCRLLYVRSTDEFSIGPHLEAFAGIAEGSKEFQGHGWGAAFLEGGEWKIHRSITPVWRDDLGRFGSTRLLVAHARSAFRDEGICVENNMPFRQERDLFVFNGELHGVKVRSPGRIGAEKIFNYIRRFDRGDLEAAVRRAVAIIAERSRYVRAMNMIVGSPEKMVLCSMFSADPGYFTLYTRNDAKSRFICSERYPGSEGWEPVPNNTIEVIP